MPPTVREWLRNSHSSMPTAPIPKNSSDNLNDTIRGAPTGHDKRALPSLLDSILPDQCPYPTKRNSSNYSHRHATPILRSKPSVMVPTQYISVRPVMAPVMSRPIHSTTCDAPPTSPTDLTQGYMPPSILSSTTANWLKWNV